MRSTFSFSDPEPPALVGEGGAMGMLERKKAQEAYEKMWARDARKRKWWGWARKIFLFLLFVIAAIALALVATA